MQVLSLSLYIPQAEQPECSLEVQSLTCHFEQMRELYIAKGRDIMRNVPGGGILPQLKCTLPMGATLLGQLYTHMHIKNWMTLLLAVLKQTPNCQILFTASGLLF